MSVKKKYFSHIAQHWPLIPVLKCWKSPALTEQAWTGHIEFTRSVELLRRDRRNGLGSVYMQLQIQLAQLTDVVKETDREGFFYVYKTFPDSKTDLLNEREANPSHYQKHSLTQPARIRLQNPSGTTERKEWFSAWLWQILTSNSFKRSWVQFWVLVAVFVGFYMWLCRGFFLGVLVSSQIPKHIPSVGGLTGLNCWGWSWRTNMVKFHKKKKHNVSFLNDLK